MVFVAPLPQRRHPCHKGVTPATKASPLPQRRHLKSIEAGPNVIFCLVTESSEGRQAGSHALHPADLQEPLD